MMIFTNSALEERGIWPEYLITSGNETGLSVADYIAFFAGESRTESHPRLYRGDRQPRSLQGRLPAGAGGGQGDRRAQARAIGGRAAGGDGAYRLARRFGGSVRRDGGRTGRDPRRHARRCDRDHGAAGAYRRAARAAARRDHAVGRVPRVAARCGRAQRLALRGAGVGDHGEVELHPHRRVAGEQPDRRRLWRAHQRRQLQELDRRARSRSQRRHGAAAGSAAARGRLAARRALYRDGRAARRRRREEADRLRHADLARAERPQPRVGGEGAARLVPAGSEQGAARDRVRRPAR